MVEYIDRKNFLKRLFAEYPHQAPHGAIVVQMLCDEDPADVRPVVRSYWKMNDNGTYSCERCHSWIPEEQRYYANWCLYCGSDMRGEVND